MPTSIVVPLDGSPQCEQTLPLVEALAEREGAEIHLLYVAETRVPNDERESLTPYRFEGLEWEGKRWRQEIRERGADYLIRLAERLSAHGSQAVTTTLLSTPTAGKVHGFADAIGADLLVLPIPGPHVQDAWLSEVAPGLVPKTGVPLLLVPTTGEFDLKSVRFERVLVPLDGSLFAEQVIGRVRELDPALTMELVLLEVVPPPRRSLPLSSSGLPVADAKLMSRQGHAQDYLRRVSSELRDGGVTVSSRVMVHRSPAVAILEAARDHDADLVAMATHGRGGLSRALLGSVSAEVVRAADRPILLHRPLTDMILI